METQQERAVAQGLRDGKAEAWQTLYETYAEQVWRCAARLLGPSSADVADVVQETFLAAARAAASYDSARGSLWLWLWGIARNQIALHYRKQQRHDRIRHAEAWLATHASPLLDGPSNSPPEMLEAVELAALVRATLAGLPLDYETVLTARYLDGTTVEAIADQEQATQTAVRSRLARARQAFRQAFEKYTTTTSSR